MNARNNNSRNYAKQRASATTQIMFHLFASSFFMISAIKSTHTETEKPFQGNRCAVCTPEQNENNVCDKRNALSKDTTTTKATRKESQTFEQNK